MYVCIFKNENARTQEFMQTNFSNLNLETCTWFYGRSLNESSNFVFFPETISKIQLFDFLFKKCFKKVLSYDKRFAQQGIES